MTAVQQKGTVSLPWSWTRDVALMVVRIARHWQVSGSGVRGDRSAETIADRAPLDFPASLAFHGRDLLGTNFALYSATAGKASAAPALLKLAAP